MSCREGKKLFGEVRARRGEGEEGGVLAVPWMGFVLLLLEKDDACEYAESRFREREREREYGDGYDGYDGERMA